MKGNARAVVALVLAALLLGVTARPAGALRANAMRDLARLEQMGHHEQVLYYRMSSRDMVRSLHAAWSGAPYDPIRIHPACTRS